MLDPGYRLKNKTTLALIACLLAVAVPLLAQASAGYDLSWWTVDGGGGTLGAAGGYSLTGTIGQPEAGSLGDGAYTLSGGFWPGGRLPAWYHIYLPLLLRNL
ncbi:MAG: hypothetical protein KKA73_18195 [Chloroflexi bacterium]|nr:hypothetical protein [Chloroflexota bacterium]MBU1749619.1 hypothetical protein [Chloroflexota bacterium]